MQCAPHLHFVRYSGNRLSVGLLNVQHSGIVQLSRSGDKGPCLSKAVCPDAFCAGVPLHVVLTMLTLALELLWLHANGTHACCSGSVAQKQSRCTKICMSLHLESLAVLQQGVMLLWSPSGQ